MAQYRAHTSAEAADVAKLLPLGLNKRRVTRSMTVRHTTFKVKGQGHQAALLRAALTRKAAAAVSVGKYCYVVSARRRATGEERGGGILCRHAHSLLYVTSSSRTVRMTNSQCPQTLRHSTSDLCLTGPLFRENTAS